MTSHRTLRRITQEGFWLLLLAGAILAWLGHFWLGLILLSAAGLAGFSAMRWP